MQPVFREFGTVEFIELKDAKKFSGSNASSEIHNSQKPLQIYKHCVSAMDCYEKLKVMVVFILE